MRDFLLMLIELIARVHDDLLRFSHSLPTELTDKQLHFLIFGVLGLLLFLLLYPLVRALVRRGQSGALAFLLAFALVLVFAFAVEIGQFVTGTGRLEVADISAGVKGFLCFGGAGALLCCAVALIRKRKKGKRK